MAEDEIEEGKNTDSSPDVRPVSDPGGGQGGISRRAVLGVGVAGTLLAAIGSRLLSREPVSAETESDYALIIDLNRCTGCRVCEQACNERNQLPEGKSFIRVLPKGDQDNHWFLPIQCQHCQNAPCAQVCPVQATYRHPSGVILVNPDLCVGCKYCAVACPYDARTYDEHTGVVSKCWLCLDWVLGGGEPACVQACVAGARIFGRRADPVIARLLNSGRIQLLHPELGTKPGVLAYAFPGT